MNTPSNGTAFISCSLNPKDEPFVSMIERIVIAHNLKPFGTVGKYSAAPVNTALLMRQNIPLADILVVVASPRYFQKNLQTGKIYKGISEMLHVEAGMAYAYGKPIVAFVQEGTNLGNFLPNITQYIVLNGFQKDLDKNWPLINNLFTNAIQMANKAKQIKSLKGFRNILVGGLAFIGGATIIDSFSDE